MELSNNKGNVAVIIVVMFVAVGIMFLYPLLVVSEQQDKVVQVQAQEIVTDYVNTVATKSEMTQEDYDNLVLSLASTGRAHDIQITVSIPDANPVEKEISLKIDGKTYYTIYTTQAKESFPLTLPKGSYIYVSAVPLGESVFEQLALDMFSKTTGSEKGLVSATAMTN